MSDLFNNAIAAIEAGIEDYNADQAKRSLTAVRNIFAGIILLAKEALISLVPTADPDVILAERIRMVPDGSGGIKLEKKGKSTLDVQGVMERFKDLKSPLPNELEKRLSELQAARNDIEHKHTSLTHVALKALIAKAFPIILYFLQFLKKNPPSCLGDAYETLVSVTESEDAERKRCLNSFSNIDFPFKELEAQSFYCDKCQSELVEQTDPNTVDHEEITCKCNLCKEIFDADNATEAAINHKYSYDLYKNGLQRVETCPQCFLHCFVTGVGCVWCKATLGQCGRCGAALTPDTIDLDQPDMCDYCGYMTAKDD